MSAAMCALVASVVLAPQSFPVGTSSGQLSFSLQKAGEPDSVRTMHVDTNTISFTDVGPGNYVVSCARLDSTGNVLGVSVSTEIVVPVGTDSVTISVPKSISVVLQ